MLAIRGVYDGKTFKALPTEALPKVDSEVSIAILFLEDPLAKVQRRASQREIAQRMRSIRDTMLPLGRSVKDLIEEGRDH